VDEALLRRLLNGHAKIPLEALFLKKVDPSPGDFTELIDEDKEMLGLNMSDLESKNLRI
jgi:hypothetical protein